MGVSAGALALYKRFADAGKLTLRIAAHAAGDSQALPDLCAHGIYRHAGGRLEMRGVEPYIYGATCSRGPALRADSSDEPADWERHGTGREGSERAKQGGWL